jgi:serine/threonine-protein kinase
VTSARPRPGDLIAGRYRIVGALGAGSTGAVYEAVHEGLGKPVALKLLFGELAATLEYRARFVREARVTCMLRHPGAVTVHDFGEHDGRPYLVMELLHGRSLRSLVDDGLPLLPLPRALAIAGQLADALAAAHAIPLVHRDVKPENVVLVAEPDGGERAVLVDFGLAFLPYTSGTLGRVTDAGLISGTPGYLSPEQGRSLEVGPPADVYSLGCVVFEMVTGAPIFAGAQGLELVAFHAYVPARAPRAARPDRNLPEALDELVVEMLAKAPARRPTAAEVRRRLADIARGGGVPARVVHARTRVSRMMDPPPPPTAPEPLDGARVAFVGAALDGRIELAGAANGIDWVVGAAPPPGVEVALAPLAAPDAVAAWVKAGVPVIAGGDAGDLPRLVALLRAGAADVVAWPGDPDDIVAKVVATVRRLRRDARSS